MIDRGGSRVFCANYSNVYSDMRMRKVTQQSIVVQPPSPDVPEVIHDHDEVVAMQDDDEVVAMTMLDEDKITSDGCSVGNELDTISVSNESIDDKSVYSNKSVNGAVSEKLYSEETQSKDVEV